MVEVDVAQLLQGLVLLADPVQGPQEQVQVRFLGEVPWAVLVLLRVQVFLTSRGQGGVLEQLETRVDAPRGR